MVVLDMDGRVSHAQTVHAHTRREHKKKYENKKLHTQSSRQTEKTEPNSINNHSTERTETRSQSEMASEKERAWEKNRLFLLFDFAVLCVQSKRPRERESERDPHTIKDIRLQCRWHFETWIRWHSNSMGICVVVYMRSLPYDFVYRRTKRKVFLLCCLR